MSFEDALRIIAAVLASVGTGGAIVLGLSSWLGKVWADRLMHEAKAKHERELQELRVLLEKDANKELARLRRDLELEAQTELARLAQRANEELAKLERDLEIYAQTHLRETGDKLMIYRAIIDVMAEVLGDFDLAFKDGQTGLTPPRTDQFNRLRVKMYGNLGMLAPQAVMDAYDALVEYLMQVASGQKAYIWADVRAISQTLLNEMRRDVGIDKAPVVFREST